MPRAAIAVLAYVLVWAASAGVLGTLQPGAWMFPATVLGVFGALALVVLLATRRWPARTGVLPRERRHAWVVGLYLMVFCVVVVGWGFTWVRGLPDPRWQAVVMLGLKLATMAAVPLLLMRMLGMPMSIRLRPSIREAMLLLALIAAMLALMALVTPALPQLQALEPSARVLAWAVPFNLAWVLLEAALSEEILFRVFLQTQLEAWMTPATAIVTAAVVFGLVHVPGLWLRGDVSMDAHNPAMASLAWAVAYSIAVLSPPALLFGVLWWRTRNLLLVVGVHAAINVLPTLPEFIRLWAA